MFLKIVAWGLIILALLLGGAEIVASLEAGEWTPQLLGQLWFMIDSSSLNLLQAVVQRYLHPVLWDPVILSVLLLPAWAVFLVPGSLLLALSLWRSRRNKPKRFLR
ncbi:hypothetical protein [Sneathiella chinensis]|uniref:hypothetical protein n=1 Tax=Sneathiella chinensis TaxID=349750 RepID=UPI0019D302AB|nr:hypothetical protein [Sneathiella chinensis]